MHKKARQGKKELKIGNRQNNKWQLKSKLTDTFIKIKQSKHTNLKEIIRMDLKNNQTVWCLQETYFKYNDIGKLKLKGGENILCKH